MHRQRIPPCRDGAGSTLPETNEIAGSAPSMIRLRGNRRSSAVSRSALPLACVTPPSTARPWRLSVKARPPCSRAWPAALALLAQSGFGIGRAAIAPRSSACPCGRCALALEHRPRQSLGRDRRPAEPRRMNRRDILAQRCQRCVRNLADRPQRMIAPHMRFQMDTGRRRPRSIATA